MFKKKIKQVILWDVLNQNHYTPIEDYIIPTQQLQPKWYKNLKQASDPRTGIGNVKGCPSFQQLFKDSYTFVSPCDFELEVSRQGRRFLQPDNVGWWRVDTHTNIANGDSQMGQEWDKDLYNIKLSSNIRISISTGRISIITLSPFYHNPRSEFIIPTGVFDIIPNTTLELNLNTFIDLKGQTQIGSKTIVVKSGQPLAMLYLPQGTLDFEKTKLHYVPRKKFFGDYKESLKKCPFH